MATARQPPPDGAARDDPTAAADRGENTEQVLARSREIREKANRQLESAREQVATARRRRGPGVGSWLIAQDSAEWPIDAREQIESSRHARERLVVLAAKLVQTEEAIAHLHDQMAGRGSRHAAQYRRAAEHARHVAACAREIQTAGRKGS